MIKNCILHFHKITKHRWIVFKLCCRAGIPWRGLVHDLSKYSPTEFFEGVKYYQGNRSPLSACKEKEGYSKAWLHHRGRNKHHPAYWYDPFAKITRPIIPYKYTVEMICDKVSASMNYNGKNWTDTSLMEYWEERNDVNILNPQIADMLTEVFRLIAIYGVKSVITKSNLKELYEKHTTKYNEKKQLTLERKRINIEKRIPRVG